MNPNFFLKYKVQFTLLSAVIVLVHLLFEYQQGGVITHYFMQDGSLPGISNWWGLLSFPVLVWVVISDMERRNRIGNSRSIIFLYRILGSVIFGVIVSYLFSMNSYILDYLMMSIFILALFLPLYFGEYLIGFTIGTMYVFGANIPIIGGTILLLILLILYKFPRVLVNLARSRT